MDDILKNVTGLAFWGSLAANGILGCFLAAQAVVDPVRRRRFAAFAAVMGYLVALDFLRIFGLLATRYPMIAANAAKRRRRAGSTTACAARKQPRMPFAASEPQMANPVTFLRMPSTPLRTSSPVPGTA